MLLNNILDSRPRAISTANGQNSYLMTIVLPNLFVLKDTKLT